MVPIAAVRQAKAKLMLKGKHRPDKMVRKKMPDGTELLASVSERSGPDEDADAERNFCAAIDKVSDEGCLRASELRGCRTSSGVRSARGLSL